MAPALPPAPAYAELQVTSNFSFLRGASHPEELVAMAAALGHRAIALTDRNSLAGVVRGHAAAKSHDIRFIPGVRLAFRDAPDLVCLPTDRAAYARLCRLLTLGKRRAAKGECDLAFADFRDHATGQLALALLPDGAGAPALAEEALLRHLQELRAACGDRAYLLAQHLYRGDDARRLARAAALAAAAGLPLVAGNDVHYHSPARRPLQDVLTCIREGCTLAQAGRRLFANAERHLKPPAEMAALFARHPDAVARTCEVAARCRFSLDELAYEYPREAGPDGEAPQAALARLTAEGAASRYPDGVPAKIRRVLAHELQMIGSLNYAPYFLTVYDIVRFARSRGILCQGRGSAANSAVCYCLGITAVDPDAVDLLFERFVSAERNEPPDIDVDFEHERREEVIQYIYGKYGRDRAALAATVICYRGRSAIRDVGKALGLSPDTVGVLARTVWGFGREGVEAEHIRQGGLDPEDALLANAIRLAQDLTGFPRHLSQHVGGFVITAGPLSEMVPIENAAMEDRTVIEWDKDDLDAVGMLKIDVLGLGMLTCIAKAFALIAAHHGRRFDLATVPQDDARVYDMLCRADSIGVFQVESRAQMTMLPRLKPRNFYDLVIEVAIVRPGPIQGDMVHPYLRRRHGEERVSYPSPALEEVLGKTLGVPLFQEQAMRIAIVAAGFTPSESDHLRRAMATFRKVGTIHEFRRKLVEGMVARGYERDFAERCFQQIEGFGEYGFPESHAASFALLVYVSAWLKRHYPAVFACAILNAQPMGFYAPAQLVRDARDHGVQVRAVDVNHSEWDCTLEPLGPAAGRRPADAVALRLGFRQVKGAREVDIAQLLAARMAGGPFRDMADLHQRSGLGPQALQVLAAADAFRSVGLDRRHAEWQAAALGEGPLPLFAHAEDAERAATGGRGSNRPALDGGAEPAVTLPAMALGEHVLHDYAQLRLSLKAHPMQLLRPVLEVPGLQPSAALAQAKDGSRVTVAGLVLVRQRPGTASGVIFATLEDEAGVANVVIWPAMFERFRRAVLGARLMLVRGKLQREGLVIHVIADHLQDLSDRLAWLADLHGEARPDDAGQAPAVEGVAEAFAQGMAGAMARADEVRRPPNEKIVAALRSRRKHHPARPPETLAADTPAPGAGGSGTPTVVKVDFPGSRDFH
ncbi:MAG: error-prone DNA polymerase [Sneathiellaceae bacterium]